MKCRTVKMAIPILMVQKQLFATAYPSFTAVKSQFTPGNCTLAAENSTHTIPKTALKQAKTPLTVRNGTLTAAKTVLTAAKRPLAVTNCSLAAAKSPLTMKNWQLTLSNSKLAAENWTSSIAKNQSLPILTSNIQTLTSDS